MIEYLDDETGSLLSVHLFSGRLIQCRQYFVSRTYEGMLIRTPSERTNQLMLSIISDDAIRMFGDFPVHILHPQESGATVDYPPIRFSGRFSSSPISSGCDLSSLIVIWFQRDQWPVDHSACEALETLEWENLASDRDF